MQKRDLSILCYKGYCERKNMFLVFNLQVMENIANGVKDRRWWINNFMSSIQESNTARSLNSRRCKLYKSHITNLKYNNTQGCCPCFGGW